MLEMSYKNFVSYLVSAHYSRYNISYISALAVTLLFYPFFSDLNIYFYYLMPLLPDFTVIVCHPFVKELKIDTFTTCGSFSV